jgi:3',5'-cyclic AMP phosphodiesterase CpdA
MADSTKTDGDTEVLFRFRDLVAPTLDEHEAVIKKEKACWWGWWKRPLEDARTDVWSLLDSRLKDTQEVRILLFDSGKDQVHQAWITRVVPPPANAVDDWGPVALPKPQQKLIPAYYRRSPFSRAWMQIVRIERNFDFFGRYSLDGPPRVTNYPPELLKRLADKVIIDGAELRGMDTTIWLVRPKRDTDKTEHLITAGAAPVTKSLSDTPILCKGSTILHVTDPHFATGANRKYHRWRLESEKEDARDTLAEAISRAIQAKNVGVLVVSGDLTFSGDLQEYDEARRFLGRIVGNTGIGFEHIVVCPGNHDIQWKPVPPDSSEEHRMASEEAKANYVKLYSTLFRHDAGPHLSMARRFVMPNGITVEICALNSSSLATNDQVFPGVGRVQGAAFQEAESKLGWSSHRGLALRMLAIHHHLAPVDDAENLKEFSKGFGMAMDAAKTLRMAARASVHLVLHGHKHRAFIWRSNAYEVPEETNLKSNLGYVSILGGGSAGSTDVIDHKNFFNLLELDSTKVKLSIYRAKSGQEFQPMHQYGSPLSLVNGQLLLGEWEAESK